MDVTLYITSARYSYSKDDSRVTYSCCNEFTSTESDIVKLHVMMSCMCVLMRRVRVLYNSYITVVLWAGCYTSNHGCIFYQEIIIFPRS